MPAPVTFGLGSTCGAVGSWTSGGFVNLFDDFERTDPGRAAYAETGFRYLNRSARSDVSRVRELLEAWFARYPTEYQPDLASLIDAIVLTPNQGELHIELKGNLAAMLGAAQNAKRSPETGDRSLQVVMVAGARIRLYRKLCWVAA